MAWQPADGDGLRWARVEPAERDFAPYTGNYREGMANLRFFCRDLTFWRGKGSITLESKVLPIAIGFNLLKMVWTPCMLVFFMVVRRLLGRI